MKITDRELRTARDDVERIKQRLNDLYFKMEEAEEPLKTDPIKDRADYGRYILAKDDVSNAADLLLSAMDLLRVKG